MKEKHGGIDLDRQRTVERTVSQYIQEHFSFVVVRFDEKEERLRLESKMISTISLCDRVRRLLNGWASPRPRKKFATVVFGSSTNSTKDHFLSRI